MQWKMGVSPEQTQLLQNSVKDLTKTIPDVPVLQTTKGIWHEEQIRTGWIKVTFSLFMSDFCFILFLCFLTIPIEYISYCLAYSCIQLNN